jgi:SNF2 family DNA or RNA helicase
MNAEEQHIYNTLESALIVKLKGVEITAANAASLCGKLSQMASGAIYSEDKDVISIHDRKIDALEDILEAANGNPLLIAYWFKHDLERIQSRLDKLKLNYSTLDKSENFIKWNKGKLQIGLIHPASAGHGLNLQFGGYNLVWFCIPWSLELYQQTIARLYRQGQKSNVVVVQHIVTKGTIDEDILKALSRKEKTQTALIDAVKANLKGVKYESI